LGVQVAGLISQGNYIQADAVYIAEKLGQGADIVIVFVK